MVLAALAFSLWKRHSAPAAPSSETDVRAVYQQHRTFVWKTLSRLGVAESDLLDCTQEVFVVVHRKLPERENTSSITTWLYGICLRVAAAYRRRAHRRYEVVTDDLPDPEDNAASSPEHGRRRAEGARILDNILSQMPPNARVVFVMFELDELSCPEIAAELDCPLGTIHTRLRAARKVFEEAIKNDGELASNPEGAT